MKCIICSCAIIILCILPGCFHLGSPCKKPVLPIPAQFSNSPINTSSTDLIDWWKSFNDPILEQLIKQAINSNYDLQKALEKIEEVRCIYNIRKADLMPLVYGFGFALDAQLSREIPLFAALEENPTGIFGLGLASNWELDIFGRLRSARNAACADFKAQIEIMRDVYIMLIADVAQLYVQARTLEIKLTISKQRATLDQDILALLRSLNKSGLLDNSPLALQEQQAQDSANSIIFFQALLTQTYNNLAVLTGQMPECFHLEPGNGQVPHAYDIVRPGLPSELLRRRPDIRQAEQRLIASNERVREAIADFFPKFSLLGLVASLSTTLKHWFDGDSLTWIIGPAFSWPIITFGRITYNVKAKKSVHRQALHAYCQTVLQAFADVENSLSHYFAQESQLNNYEKKAQAATKDALLFQSRFKAGLSDKTQYYIAEKNRLNALLQTIDAQKELSSALISVYKSLGGGWNHASDCA